MTVKELIEELSKFDQDLTILDDEDEQPGEIYTRITEDGLVVSCINPDQ